MPDVTSPNGAKPDLSSVELSLKLMKNCVVRVPGPAVANDAKPRLLLLLHRIVCDPRVAPGRLHAGLPLMPTCAMKSSSTRKKRQSS